MYSYVVYRRLIIEMTLDKEITDRKGFIRRLRKIVRDFGSVSLLAKKIDIPSPTIYRYLTEQATPYAVFFDRLAGIGIDIGWLLTGRPTAPVKREAAERRSETDDRSVIMDKIMVEIYDLKKKDREEIFQVIRMMAEAKRVKK